MSRISAAFHHCGGHAMAQLVEAPCYIPEGSGFVPRWYHRNSSLTVFPGVDSASNSHEYQEYFLGGKGGRCVGLTTIPPSCADCHEIWGPQPPGTRWVSPCLLMGFFCFVPSSCGRNLCAMGSIDHTCVT